MSQPVRAVAASCSVALLAMASLAAPALAGQSAGDGASPWVKADYIEARLITATEGVGSGDTLLAAIDIKIEPKWKTYWRTPGDAGLPPEPDWSDSKNVAQTTLLYPAPVRFQLFGLQTFGYETRVVFPVRVKLEAPGAATELDLTLNALVCSDVCVPQVVKLDMAVPEGPATPTEHSHRIQRAVSAVPTNDGTSGLDVARVEAVDGGKAGALSVALTSDKPLTDLDVVPEVEPFVAFSAPDINLSADRRAATVRLPIVQPLPPGEQLADRNVTLTVIDSDRAREVHTKIIDAGTGSGGSDRIATLALMLSLALVGGLILNLMPCVLPVLSVKLMSFIEARDAATSDVRQSFLATAAGIVASLIMVAGALIAIKSAGHAVGWGIQFQQPVFIALMAVIVTVFACNLWGFFEITLPSWLGNWAAGQGQVGGGAGSHFLTGIFVTLLATPCSAPFVGTAVGFALASGTVETLAIFTMLGIGLALPYLLVAARPALVRFMPRPGSWMITLRWILGAALAATAIWLLTVLATQAGLQLAVLTGAALLVLIGVLSARHLRPNLISGTLAAVLALVLSATAIAVPLLHDHTNPEVAEEEDGPIDWAKFDEPQIRSLIAQGKTVFVDVTADWCITCKANKRLVINRDPVAGRLQSGITAMKADWTSPDPKITKFLSRFGRYGIPLNVVFGPGRPQGILLPEILTSDSVLRALDQAGRNQNPGA